jgi:predicted nucleic acid-binding protein
LTPEIGATLGRRQTGTVLARRFVEQVAGLPGLNLITLDAVLAREAAALAINQRLRGADAVYAAVALRFGATLVTRDREQMERTRAVTATLSPAEALTALEP